MSQKTENQEKKEEIITIVTLYENFELKNELVEFLNQKGYVVTFDDSNIEESEEDGSARLIVVVREQNVA